MANKATLTSNGSEDTRTGDLASGTDDFLAFYQRPTDSWQSLRPVIGSLNEEQAAAERKRAKASEKDLQDYLLSSLQMQHLMVLAGSGTSLGPAAKGPSMRTLWNHCVLSNPEEAESAKQKRTENADAVIKAVNFEAAVKLEARNGENIEALLSRCEAFLQVNIDTDDRVGAFVTASKGMILSKCRDFIDRKDENQLTAHRTFLHRLSRRRVRDSRLKLFTTNYDLCFEIAAGMQGLVSMDGFSFTQPRFFDPRFYTYDVVRRSPNADDFGTPLEGVFVLYKLHGSVNWKRAGKEIVASEHATPEDVCMIFPAAGKYQQSYIQPHLELVSQYLTSLREPNTCVIAIGYGFNDDHLSEPILAAVRTNPRMRLIVVSPSAKADATNASHRYWKSLLDLVSSGHDIRLINATFQEFANIIPDLKSLTPAEQLSKELQQIAASS